MSPNSDQERLTRWPGGGEDVENDVPVSLLVETSDPSMQVIPEPFYATRDHLSKSRERLDGEGKAQRQPSTVHYPVDSDDRRGSGGPAHPRPLIQNLVPSGRREKALWRWVNISNLDSFMRDVYDYYEGGGLLCILCSNALWLLYV